ncbi:hypothetical protein F2Q70_00027598 [Brassica cretica]|uniref:Uncharacterized protein n=1 Tax=Brassica cretica TaxID=69181 RepID=A0A3N6RDK1_BRACR|nr:hypothetical protein F2Q70_00027598 [Brassica cretica]KAF3576582.1 hypothetical protein DY000_02033987 [Brassica cretica]
MGLRLLEDPMTRTMCLPNSHRGDIDPGESCKKLWRLHHLQRRKCFDQFIDGWLGTKEGASG